MTEGQKLTRREWRAAGLCPLCGATPAPGRTLCERHREALAAEARAAYRELAAKGLCLRRGCGQPKSGAHVRCRAHHEEMLAHFRRKRARANNKEKS